MKIKLIWVGKTKEPFIAEGIGKFIRLLRPYADIAVTEVKEERGKDIQRMVEKEGERVTKLGLPYVLLDEKGKCLTSVEFAGFVRRHPHDLNFLIGGAYGVSDLVKEKAADSIALSKMTLTHEMARLFLLEQLYRAHTILQKRGYHH